MTLDLESVVPAKLTAVAVFTRDLLLEVAPDGNGSSGNWVIDPTARFDRVVIENCSLERTAGIYLLDYVGDRAPDKSVRILRNRVAAFEHGQR